MEELVKKITDFVTVNQLTPNDVLTITLRFASINMVKDIVKRTNTHLNQLTDEDILKDYLEIIEHEGIESSSEV